jgi:hypothetical protein
VGDAVKERLPRFSKTKVTIFCVYLAREKCKKGHFIYIHQKLEIICDEENGMCVEHFTCHTKRIIINSMHEGMIRINFPLLLSVGEKMFKMLIFKFSPFHSASTHNSKWVVGGLPSISSFGCERIKFLKTTPRIISSKTRKTAKRKAKIVGRLFRFLIH